MELNPLPPGYGGKQKRRTAFESEDEKLQYDARNLIQLARAKYGRDNVSVRDALDLATRKDDDLETLRRYIAMEIKGKADQSGTEAGAARPTPALEPAPGSERSPEQIWFANFKTRFYALTQLHEGIEWADVEGSLKANPEAMRKLMALDEKGHAMNVFGEDGDEFIFASGWNNYEKVSEDHRNIVFDAEAQTWLAENRPGEKCNGNATDIAKALGVDLADTELHKRLRKAIGINGWAWLKTDAATRETGGAFFGDNVGISKYNVRNRGGDGSLRAALRVKKA